MYYAVELLIDNEEGVHLRAAASNDLVAFKKEKRNEEGKGLKNFIFQVEKGKEADQKDAV